MAESALAAVDEGSGALFTQLKSVYVNLRVMGAIPEGDGWKDSVSLPFVSKRIRECKSALAKMDGSSSSKEKTTERLALWQEANEIIQAIQKERIAQRRRKFEEEVDDYLNELSRHDGPDNPIMTPTKRRTGPRPGTRRKKKAADDNPAGPQVRPCPSTLPVTSYANIIYPALRVSFAATPATTTQHLLPTLRSISPPPASLEHRRREPDRACVGRGLTAF